MNPDPQLYQRAAHLFARALDRRPESRRQLVERASAGDAELCQVTLWLLDHHQEDSFLSPPTQIMEARKCIEPVERVLPENIGRYRVLGILGEGGMGVVYRGVQEKPQRRVAIKVVRPGVRSQDLWRRFDQEGASGESVTCPCG
jgi:hypothetical protein